MKAITEHYIDGAFVESHGGKVTLSINPTNQQVTPRNGRRGKAPPDDCIAPLPRHVREPGRRLVVCRTSAVRRLDGRARHLVTAADARCKDQP